MTTLEYTIEIRRPLEEVFNIVADPGQDNRWCPRVGNCEQVEGDGPSVGARYELEHSPSLQPRHTRRIEITELELPRKAVTVQEDRIARFTISYFLEPIAAGTRLTQRDDIEWKIGALSQLIGKRIINRHLGEQLHSLKRLLEGAAHPAAAGGGVGGACAPSDQWG